MRQTETSPEEDAAQKEKGRNRGLTADSPESYCTEMLVNLQEVLCGLERGNELRVVGQFEL